MLVTSAVPRSAFTDSAYRQVDVINTDLVYRITGVKITDCPERNEISMSNLFLFCNVTHTKQQARL